MEIKYNNHKKNSYRQTSILLLGLFIIILSQSVNGSFIITEVSPRPLNSTLEFVELYLLDYNGENIIIKDNFGTSTINSIRLYDNGLISDYQNETYNGYVLITQYPDYFIEFIGDYDEISCLIIGLSGRIGNGLADSGDELNVTITDTWRFFNYTNSVRGQSYNNPCDNNDCVTNNEYSSLEYYLANETPCTGLINVIIEENEEENEEEQEEVSEEEIVDDEIIEEEPIQDEESEETEEIIDEENESIEEETNEENNDEETEENQDDTLEDETEETDQETGNDNEQNDENNNVCEEIIIESQSHPYKTRIEYRIISKGLEYDYWIEYYNGSIARNPGTSKTNAIKTFTPKKGKSEQEIIYRIMVKYNDICTGEEKILHRYVMFVHPFKEEIEDKKEEVECKPNNITTIAKTTINQIPKNNLLKSFYTRAQKKADNYNYFYNTGNISENVSLYACSIFSVTEPENNKHIFPHNILGNGLPVLLALDNQNRVLEAFVGTKPEFIQEDEIIIIDFNETNNTIIADSNNELSNAITSAAIRTVKPEGIIDRKSTRLNSSHT